MMQDEPGLVEDSSDESGEDSQSEYSGLESEPDTTDEVFPDHNLATHSIMDTLF
jgi:hypothetical protein